MSLTSLIREPKISALFQEAVRNPGTLPNMPLLAPPLSKNYRRVGTAFDYLFRFYLQRLNPSARGSRWIAEEARNRIDSCPQSVDPFEYFKDPVYRNRSRLTREYLEDARVYQRAYLRTGTVTEDLLVSILRLAGLDVAYRAGPDKVEWESLEHVEPSDITDLRQIYDLTQTNDFRAHKGCILNPSFNMASTLMGGADADVVLDSRIIDIKTTKELRLDRRDLYQLVGYYLLLLLDGVCVTGQRSSETESILYRETISEITEVAIYFSRYGYLHTFPVADLVPMENLGSFTKQFTDLACPNKRERLRCWQAFRSSFAVSLRNDSLAADLTPKISNKEKREKRPGS